MCRLAGSACESGSRLGVHRLRKQFPQLGKREAEEYIKRFKVVEARQNGKLLHRLTWRKPGATWPLDLSGPVAAANFDLPEADSALRPSLDWKGPASTPNPVASPFDNFSYAVVTPDESLVYHYNAVHELTDIASTLPLATAYAETFQYDPAGALIQRTIVNPSRKSRLPIPGDLGNLPTERYTYARDPLGRVRTGSREVANLNGGFDGNALSAFTYYADSYKVRSRGVRQSATEAFQYSQPVYAGANELADVSLPPDPSTVAVLRTEYLTGGAMGTDEILAQYTAEDLLTNQGGFSPVSHPIQDVNRRVFMTLRSAVGQPTKVAERAVYSAFGERNVLERSTTDTFGNTWTPRGFGPQLTGGPRPNGLSDPLSQVGQAHGFQGRRHEDLPGVMDFRNRLYDARLGRFLERDPVSDANNPNPYAFEANNPVNNLDPMGTDLLVLHPDLWVRLLKAWGFSDSQIVVKDFGNRKLISLQNTGGFNGKMRDSQGNLLLGVNNPTIQMALSSKVYEEQPTRLIEKDGRRVVDPNRFVEMPPSVAAAPLGVGEFSSRAAGNVLHRTDRFAYATGKMVIEPVALVSDTSRAGFSDGNLDTFQPDSIGVSGFKHNVVVERQAPLWAATKMGVGEALAPAVVVLAPQAAMPYIATTAMVVGDAQLVGNDIEMIYHGRYSDADIDEQTGYFWLVVGSAEMAGQKPGQNGPVKIYAREQVQTGGPTTYKGQVTVAEYQANWRAMTGRTAVEPGPTLTAEPGQTYATGREWFDFLSQKYGTGNVKWVSGSGQTINWPSELPTPPEGVRMFRVVPPQRSSGFTTGLRGTMGPRPPGGIAHHTIPLGLNGMDNGVLNGSWVLEAPHTAGHSQLTPAVNSQPYGTEFVFAGQ